MQIVLFLLLFLAILIIFVSQKDTLDKSVKIYIIASLVLVVVLGWAYTFYNQRNAKNDREIINAYEQGKTLICGDYKVNNKNFIYVSGTLSFIAKENRKDLKGVVLDISTCRK